MSKLTKKKFDIWKIQGAPADQQERENSRKKWANDTHKQFSEEENPKRQKVNGELLQILSNQRHSG